MAITRFFFFFFFASSLFLGSRRFTFLRCCCATDFLPLRGFAPFCFPLSLPFWTTVRGDFFEPLLSSSASSCCLSVCWLFFLEFVPVSTFLLHYCLASGWRLRGGFLRTIMATGHCPLKVFFLSFPCFSLLLWRFCICFFIKGNACRVLECVCMRFLVLSFIKSAW